MGEESIELVEFRDRMAEAFQMVGERFSKDMDELRERMQNEIMDLETDLVRLEEDIEELAEKLADHVHAEGRVMVPFNG